MKRIAIDTETGYDKNTGMSIPFLATTTNEQMESRAYFVGTMGLYKKKVSDFLTIKKICEDRNIIKVFHNAVYDISMFANVGIKVVEPWSDTMLAAGILNENFSTKKLKPLAAKYLGEPCLEEKELSKVRSGITRKLRKESVIPKKIKGDKYFLPYFFVPPEILIPYALKDTEYTLKLEYLFKKPIIKYIDVYNFELSLIPIVVDLYRNGMVIDRNFVAKTIEEYSNEQKKLRVKLGKMVKKYGLKYYITKKRKSGNIKEEVQFNPDSSRHISKVVEHLQVPVNVYTQHGPSTNAKVLAPYVKDYPFLQTHFRSEWYEKQLGTYYVPFYFHHTTDDNNIAHFSYYQSAAKSGRFTAERIHQIPRKDEELSDPRVIRNCFVPPKGSYLVTIDYDQIEMRLFAHYSKCKLLIDDFMNHRDPYLGGAINMYKAMYGKNLLDKEKVFIKAKRRQSKNIMLGVIYGMGDNKMANQLGVSFMEGKEILDSFYSLYPVRDYMQKTISTLYKQGYVSVGFDSKLMKFGRDYRVPQELAYKAVNIICQGTAGYVLKAGMLRAKAWMDKNIVKIKMVASIHDEIIFYIWEKERYIIDIAKQLQETMADRITFSIPITATPKISNRSWGEVKGL